MPRSRSASRINAVRARVRIAGISLALLGVVAITGVATARDDASAAGGSPYIPQADTIVSTPSGLVACPYGGSPDFAAAYDDTEVEPQVAVNPTDPDEIVGATQQDRWPDGGARGLSSWMSSDGAGSWSKTADVPWSACQAGPARFGRVTDPWVSYDKGGNLYFLGQPIDSAALGLSAVAVSTWNGSSWTAPKILIEDEGDRGIFNDKISVTGDPTRAGYAYATWIRGTFPNDGRQNPTADFHSFAYRGMPMISRTTDGGQTWSTPAPMRRSNSFFQGNQIAVGPDGTLYNVAANLFTGAGLNANGAYMALMRSTDAGRTWSAPTQLGRLGTAQLFVADDGFPIRAGDYIPDISVDPVSGTIYVVWADGLGTPYNKIVMATSTDDGRHWSGPTIVSAGGPRTQAYNHAVEVTENGTVVLTYFDDRNNDPSDGVATTDIWLRHSHDGAVNWEPEQHLHGPFDHYLAPISFFAPGEPRGLFLGDYMGLETISGDDVIAFFTSTIADGADVHAIRLNHP
jgi:hypothetical protein